MPNSELAQLYTLARSRGLRVDHDIFDAGETVSVRGTIGRLPYAHSVTREWGDAQSAAGVMLAILQDRLAMKVRS